MGSGEGGGGAGELLGSCCRSLGEHKHHHSQVTYCIDGEWEFTIGGVTQTVKDGDSVYIPPHVLHGATCTKAGILIDVFSPIREDFME